MKHQHQPERELPTYRHPDREYDAVGRQVIRPLPALSILQGIPGLAGQFRKEVPASHLEDRAVRCTCGTVTPVEQNKIRHCDGDCGRYFLRGGERVYVAGPYPVDDDQAAAA